jgi:predicted metalloprotease with PDZ domain
VRKRNAGRAWLGDLRLESRAGVRVANLVAPTWPIYAAGVDLDDELQQVDGQRVTNEGDVATILQRHKPGDRIAVTFRDRTTQPRTAMVTLAEDPHVDVLVADATPAQRAFRDKWLGPK